MEILQRKLFSRNLNKLLIQDESMKKLGTKKLIKLNSLDLDTSKLIWPTIGLGGSPKMMAPTDQGVGLLGGGGVMNRSIIIIALAILACFAQSAFGGMLSFQAEAERATRVLNCPRPKITPASTGLGALYGCIAGSAETVKFFINEAEGISQVKNVKLMWNDWFVDVGYAIHSDKKVAQAFVKAFAKLYAPNIEKKLQSIFFSNSNTTLVVGGYQIAYTYSRGPKIDERLLVLTPKGVLAAKEQLRKSSSNDFDICKAAVSKATGYQESLLSGDGEPTQEAGYKSFMLKGRGKDLFFCEVHSGGRYKVKAALNGNFPFKYIAEGTY